MISSNFNFKIISLDTVESTNIYALDLIQQKKAMEGTVVWSQFQEKGKGQLENGWYSNAYKNLTFTLVIEPNWPIEEQFVLSQKIALAVATLLDSMSVKNVKVKWPNDILIDSRKVAGILIENLIQGTTIGKSVVGIGLNVNEEEFPEFNRAATSLRLETGRLFVIEELLHSLLKEIQEELKVEKRLVNERYLARVHGYGELLHYEDKEEVFEGTIVGVLPNGALQVNKNGKLKTYENKEIRFLS